MLIEIAKNADSHSFVAFMFCFAENGAEFMSSTRPWNLKQRRRDKHHVMTIFISGLKKAAYSGAKI